MSSAVLDHMEQCEGCKHSNNIAEQFSIIRQCSRMDILSQEALLIKQCEPALNTQLGPYKGSRVGINIFA